MLTVSISFSLFFILQEHKQQLKAVGCGNCLVWAGFSVYLSCFESILLVPYPNVLRHFPKPSFILD